MLLIGVIDGFVNEEVELHGMQPVHGFVIGTIKRFGNADAKFGGFGRHRWRGRKAGEEQWWWWWWRKREERSENNGCRGRWSGDPGDGEGRGKVVG